MSQLHLAWAVAALLAVIVVIIAIRWRLNRWRRSMTARTRGQTASRGEREAEALLEEMGFAIIDRQASLSWAIRCDDEAIDIDLRADLIVERDGRRLVAEVKTGQSAPSLKSAATRRQLLEYLVAYEVDAVLLVDMTHREVHEVTFPR